MNTINKKFKKSVIYVALTMGLLGINTAYADNNTDATVSQSTTSMVLAVPTYSSAELAAAGCDQTVWNKMVSDYQTKAQTKAAIGAKVAQMQGANAPSPVTSCFTTAAQLVNSATKAYNTISSILTGGGLDSSKLFDYATKIAVGAACSQLNSIISQSGLGATIGQVNSTINGALGTSTSIGGVNTGSVSTILNNAGISTTSNTATTVTSTTLANATGVSSVLSSINPFK